MHLGRDDTLERVPCESTIISPLELARMLEYFKKPRSAKEELCPTVLQARELCLSEVHCRTIACFTPGDVCARACCYSAGPDTRGRSRMPPLPVSCEPCIQLRLLCTSCISTCRSKPLAFRPLCRSWSGWAIPEGAMVRLKPPKAASQKGVQQPFTARQLVSILRAA